MGSGLLVETKVYQYLLATDMAPWDHKGVCLSQSLFSLV